MLDTLPELACKERAKVKEQEQSLALQSLIQASILLQLMAPVVRLNGIRLLIKR